MPLRKPELTMRRTRPRLHSRGCGSALHHDLEKAARRCSLYDGPAAGAIAAAHNFLPTLCPPGTNLGRQHPAVAVLSRTEQRAPNPPYTLAGRVGSPACGRDGVGDIGLLRARTVPLPDARRRTSTLPPPTGGRVQGRPALARKTPRAEGVRQGARMGTGRQRTAVTATQTIQKHGCSDS